MTIRSDGMDHVPWRGLPGAALVRESVYAKRTLEDTLEAPVRTAACPFGAYDRRSLRAVRDAGFTRVFTSDRRWVRSQDWLVARNTACRWDAAKSIERMLDGAGASEMLWKGKQWIKKRL